MAYYYTYPTQGPPDERMRMPMHPAEAQARGNSASSLSQHQMRLQPLHPDMDQRESKPRLSKEQQDMLERHFQAQPKPSTTTKRGFAENLNVPIDKINNWFQNRRAKVKQDAKKQQGAPRDTLNPNQSFDNQPSADSAVINTTFAYDPRSRVQSTTPHVDMPAVNDFKRTQDNTDAFTFDLNADGSYVTSNFTVNDSDAFNNFFGLDDNPSGVKSEIDYEAISAFGKQFSQPLDTFSSSSYLVMPPNMDALHTTSASSTSLAQSGLDESFNFISNGIEDAYSSSVASAQLSSADSRNSSPNWAASNRVDEQMEKVQQGQMMLHHMAQLPLRQKHSIGQAIATMPEQQQHQYLQQNQQQQRQLTPTPHNRSQQGSGSTSNHAMTDVHMNTNTELSLPLRQQSSTSSLASRRQRRPAALGNLRSTSYQSLNTAAPAVTSPLFNTSATSPVPEQNLRRIKSSMGFINGRVHKVSSAKSPLSLAFAESATSPRLVKQRSSMSNLRGTSTGIRSLAPPTPSSPFHMDESPEVHKTLWTPLQPNPLDETAWCNSPMAAGQGSAMSYASPPSTPFDGLQRFANVPSPYSSSPTAGPSPTRNNFPSGPPSDATTPLAPPPLPQQFMTSQPPLAAGPRWLSALSQHMLRPPQPQQIVYAADPRMLPPNMHFAMAPPGMLNQQQQQHQLQQQQQQQQVTMVPVSIPSPHGYQMAYQLQPTYQVPMGYGYPFPPPEYMHLQQQQNAPQYFGLNAVVDGGSSNSNMKPPPPQELEIHEYSPREPVDPAVLPPKARPARQPKNFVFTNNQGPEHFVGSP